MLAADSRALRLAATNLAESSDRIGKKIKIMITIMIKSWEQESQVMCSYCQ